MIFSLFKHLNNNQIEFALTNGYEDLASYKDTNADIDILFKKSDFNKIEYILHDFCTLHGFKLVQVLHHDAWAKNAFIYCSKTHDLLNLDIYGELSRNGITYFDEEAIFASLDNYQDIPIISSEKEFISYLAKKIDKKDLSIDSFTHLKELYITNPKCKVELSTLYPKSHNLVNEAFASNDINLISNNMKQLAEEPYKQKKFNLQRIIHNYLRIIKRVIKPTGICIAFLGPDGSGKTTIINSIINAKLPFRRRDNFHLKPIYITKTDQSSSSDPHQHPAYSRIKSYLKILYFIFQYNNGWITNIIPLRIRSSLIIFDRYYDDLLVDQKRYRYGGGEWFLRIARIFIPRPELYFILLADPHTTYERKKEINLNELVTLTNKYEKLAENSYMYKIDANRTPKDISNEVIAIIMSKMSERHSKNNYGGKS
jgi:thymidylate kinase